MPAVLPCPLVTDRFGCLRSDRRAWPAACGVQGKVVTAPAASQQSTPLPVRATPCLRAAPGSPSLAALTLSRFLQRVLEAAPHALLPWCVMDRGDTPARALFRLYAPHPARACTSQRMAA